MDAANPRSAGALQRQSDLFYAWRAGRAIPWGDSILGEGHTLGNHSFDHQSFDGITRQGFKRAVDAYMCNHAGEHGCRATMWNVDPQDWRRPEVTAIMTRVLNEVQTGDIVLFHNGSGDCSQRVSALDLILKDLSSQGYEFALVCY